MSLYVTITQEKLSGVMKACSTVRVISQGAISEGRKKTTASLVSAKHLLGDTAMSKTSLVLCRVRKQHHTWKSNISTAMQKKPSPWTSGR